jgi:hypothetical protein
MKSRNVVRQSEVVCADRLHLDPLITVTYKPVARK